MLNTTAKFKMENKFDTPEAIAAFNRSQETATRLKDLGQEIKAVESVLLKERNQQALEQAKMANAILIIGKMISFIFLLVAFILIHSELTIRQNLKKEIRR